MGIDAKQTLTERIREGCADIVTVRQMEQITQVITEALDAFTVTQQVRNDWSGTEDDMMEAFLASMRVQGRSEGTIYQYRRMIRIFRKYVQVNAREVNAAHIRAWLSGEKERGIQDSTLNNDRQILSSYFGWLHREALISRNPVSNVGTIKVAKKIKKTFDKADIERMMRKCKEIRDQAIVQFLASTGCRISEMTGLDWKMVDMEAGEVVVHGKGNKERTVYINEVAMMLLKQYLGRRKDLNPALFVGRYGERLQPGGVQEMLRKLGKAADVDHVHPHKFRRTLATELARKGMPIQEIANILGHERLDTTMRYVVLNKEDVKSSYRRLA